MLTPFFVGLGVAAILYFTTGWWGFLLIFPWIAGWISVGLIISSKLQGKKKDLGRRIAILMAAPIFLAFLGIVQHENLQLEETIFYFAAGVFSRVLIHYSVAKVFGPLIWGRGFCGWACWTAAVMDWLPIKENKSIPKKLTWIRVPVFMASIATPLAFIFSGYDYFSLHVKESLGKWHQFIWFLIGNGVYYIAAVSLAFALKKKRAFCKIACPVSLVMKPSSIRPLVKRKPTGEKCTECGACNRQCPMDVDIMSFIRQGKAILNTECILCGLCKHVCPAGAID